MGSRGFLRHKMIVEIRAKQQQKQKAARLSSAQLSFPPLANRGAHCLFPGSHRQKKKGREMTSPLTTTQPESMSSLPPLPAGSVPLASVEGFEPVRSRDKRT